MMGEGILILILLLPVEVVRRRGLDNTYKGEDEEDEDLCIGILALALPDPDPDLRILGVDGIRKASVVFKMLQITAIVR